MERVTIAAVGTTHPLSVAGLLLDVRVAHRLGARVVTVVAGVSAQDAHGVRLRRALDAEAIGAQFAALRDAEVGAFHVGALLDAASADAVAAGLAAYGDLPVVWDPVLAASVPGGTLVDPAEHRAILATLLPRVRVLTPNRREAAALLHALGETMTVDDETAAAVAATRLVAAGAPAVLVTGGDADGTTVVDVLVQRGAEPLHFAGTRLDGSLRGTGDLLGAALAAHVARGAPLPDAVERARAFVRAEIEAGEPFAGSRAARWD